MTLNRACRAGSNVNKPILLHCLCSSNASIIFSTSDLGGKRVRFWFQHRAIWLAAALLAVSAFLAGLNQRHRMEGASAPEFSFNNVSHALPLLGGVAALALLAFAFWLSTPGSGKQIAVLVCVFAAALLFDAAFLIFGVLGYVAGKPVVSEFERLTGHNAKSYLPPYDAILFGAVFALLICLFFYFSGYTIQTVRFAKSRDIWNFFGFFAVFLSFGFVFSEFFLGLFAEQRKKGFGYAVMSLIGAIMTIAAVSLVYALSEHSTDTILMAFIFFPLTLPYLIAIFAVIAILATIGLTLFYSGLVSEPKGLLRLTFAKVGWLDGILSY